jgi:hypothetical protein
MRPPSCTGWPDLCKVDIEGAMLSDDWGSSVRLLSEQILDHSNRTLKLFTDDSEKAKGPNLSRARPQPPRQRTGRSVWTNREDCPTPSPNLDGEVSLAQQPEYLFDSCLGKATLRSGECPERGKADEHPIAG